MTKTSLLKGPANQFFSGDLSHTLLSSAPVYVKSGIWCWECIRKSWSSVRHDTNILDQEIRGGWWAILRTAAVDVSFSLWKVFVLSVSREHGAAELLCWPDLSHLRVDVTHWPANCSGLGLGLVNIFSAHILYAAPVSGLAISFLSHRTAPLLLLSVSRMFEDDLRFCWLLTTLSKHKAGRNSPSINQNHSALTGSRQADSNAAIQIVNYLNDKIVNPSLLNTTCMTVTKLLIWAFLLSFQEWVEKGTCGQVTQTWHAQIFIFIKREKGTSAQPDLTQIDPRRDRPQTECGYPELTRTGEITPTPAAWFVN